MTKSNQNYYNNVWSGLKLHHPSRYNTWPTLSPLAEVLPSRLEIGPGLRPRLPIFGTHFVDLSQVVVNRLNKAGGVALLGDINSLPFPDQQFDMICAFEVLEHVADDNKAVSELSRVLKDDSVLFFSVPLDNVSWSEFDIIVGHFRRYNHQQVLSLITSNYLILEQSAAFGMMPVSQRTINFGMWCLKCIRKPTLRLYELLIYPAALLFQQKLNLVPGLTSNTNAESMLFVCKRDCR